ncbi:MAG: FeoA family protein [Roseicyclus sp.]
MPASSAASRNSALNLGADLVVSQGLTPGTEFELARCAPMGDPVEIRVRGFSLSLRRDEADTFMVERGQR